MQDEMIINSGRFGFSKRKVMENIKSTPVYPYEFKTDRYGNTEYNYPEESAYNLELIWLPISSQLEIAEYGERINEMMQACLFSDDEIKEKDRVSISGILYNIIAVKPYPSYRLLLAERVR